MPDLPSDRGGFGFGEAPEERRLATAERGLALTRNLDGYRGEMVSFVSITGTD